MDSDAAFAAPKRHRIGYSGRGTGQGARREAGKLNAASAVVRLAIVATTAMKTDASVVGGLSVRCPKCSVIVEKRKEWNK